MIFFLRKLQRTDYTQKKIAVKIIIIIATPSSKTNENDSNLFLSGHRKLLFSYITNFDCFL